MSSPIGVWIARLMFLAAFAGWCAVVLYVDPETGGVRARTLFYATLLVWLAAFFAAVLWEIRRLFVADGRRAFRRSLRHGFLMAVLATAILAMREYRVLLWWDAALLLAGILLVELWMRGREESLPGKERNARRAGKN